MVYGIVRVWSDAKGIVTVAMGPSKHCISIRYRYTAVLLIQRENSRDGGLEEFLV